MIRVVEALMPVLAPLAIATVGAVVASTIITSRRLRTDLQQESEMLERLPPGARAELRADVRRRTLILVSLNRFPPVTRVDLLAMIGIALTIGAVFFALHLLGEDDRSDVEFSFGLIGQFSPVYAFLIWLVFHKNWAERALSRIRYLHKHLGPAEPQPVARMVLVGYVASLAILLVITGLLSGLLGGWINRAGWFTSDLMAVAGLLLTMLAYLGLTIAIARRDGLAMEIHYTLSDPERLARSGSTGSVPRLVSRWRQISDFEEERAEAMRML
ncbi:hypothetical protein [Promicromonospora sp. NPDC059942]|uniref:hypothetical protein n=1 Tax=Promicromonospora sp. NPDC059942 TaxID=3347009 RepID=UPI0036493D37